MLILEPPPLEMILLEDIAMSGFIPTQREGFTEKRGAEGEIRQSGGVHEEESQVPLSVFSLPVMDFYLPSTVEEVLLSSTPSAPPLHPSPMSCIL